MNDGQAPPEASANRTLEVIEQVENVFGQEEAVESVIAILGFSFSGTGQNAGLAFIDLVDWSERDEENAAAAIAARANGALFQLKDALTVEECELPAEISQALEDVSAGFARGGA